MNPQAYAQVKKLFMKSLELPADRRASFLEETCHNEEIRAEVLALLRNHTQQTLLTNASMQETTALADLVGDTRKMNLLARARTTAQTLIPKDHRFRRVLVAGSMFLAALVSFWLYTGVRGSLREIRTQQLETLVDAEQASIGHWVIGQKSKVASWARDPEFRAAVEELTSLTFQPGDATPLRSATAQTTIRAYLNQVAGKDVEFSVWNRSLITISDGSTGSGEPHSDCLGRGVTDQGAVILNRVFEGTSELQMPHTGEFIRRSVRAGEEPQDERQSSPATTSDNDDSESKTDGEFEPGVTRLPPAGVSVFSGISSLALE